MRLRDKAQGLSKPIRGVLASVALCQSFDYRPTVTYYAARWQKNLDVAQREWETWAYVVGFPASEIPKRMTPSTTTDVMDSIIKAPPRRHPEIVTFSDWLQSRWMAA